MNSQINPVKLFLLVCLILASRNCRAQSDLIRTDGVYLFDNGLEFTEETGNYARGLKSQYLYIQPGGLTDNRPCGTGDAIAIDITENTFLSIIIFFSDSVGRTLTVGACRDEENIRKKVLAYVLQQATSRQPKYSNNHSLDSIVIAPDSSIQLQDTLLRAYQDYYYGNIIEDSLELVYTRRVANCEQVYAEKRRYIFYSFDEIFNCNWVYVKPIPILKK